MNVLIVFAHPERKSFNGALFDTAVDTLQAAGHTVVTSDLYAMHFDPSSSRANFTACKDPDYFKPQVEELHATGTGGFSPELEAEIRKLEAADLVIFQFPLWWFGLPAILKGWVDRVFAMGRAYGGGRVYESGVFRGKRALLSLTTGGPEAAYMPGGFNGDLRGILRPIHRGVFEFCGFSVLAPAVFYGPVRAEEAERAKWLAAWAARLRQIEQESPIEVGHYA
ncbi:MAG: NAD(P)H-dependent oxidoreductase [Terracidiphilus sp.]